MKHASYRIVYLILALIDTRFEFLVFKRLGHQMV